MIHGIAGYVAPITAGVIRSTPIGNVQEALTGRKRALKGVLPGLKGVEPTGSEFQSKDLPNKPRQRFDV